MVDNTQYNAKMQITTGQIGKKRQFDNWGILNRRARILTAARWTSSWGFEVVHVPIPNPGVV